MINKNELKGDTATISVSSKSYMFIYAKIGNSKFVEMHRTLPDIYPSALVFYTRQRVNITSYRTVYLHPDESCIPVITHICVIFSRRTMSLSICLMVQLYIACEWKYSTTVNCHCQSKTEKLYVLEIGK
jgi:hypothetical protein